MGNVHDKAYALAREIKQLPEFVRLKELQKQIEQNPNQKLLLVDLQKRQIEWQSKQMQGIELNEEEFKQMNDLVQKVQQEPALNHYLELEQRLSVIMGDVQRIISEPLQSLFNESQQGGEA